MKIPLLSKHTMLAAAILSLGTSFVASAAAGSEPAVGTLVLASSDASGKIKPGLTSPCAISADGSLVAFTSSASELVAGDTNGSDDVFLKNVRTGAITRVSTSSTGAQFFNGLTGGATCLGMTPDGNSIVLRTSTPSSAGGTFLNPGREQALFVKNLRSGSLRRISPSLAAFPDAREYLYRSISDDGNTVAFVTTPSSTFGGPFSSIPGGPGRTLIRDLRTGTLTDLTSIITLDLAPFPTATISTMKLSPDGSLLAFDSRADHPVAGDTNGKSDVFVLNLTTGNLRIVSTDSFGQSNVFGGPPAFSPSFAVSGFLAGGATLAIYVPGQASLGAEGLYFKNLNDDSLSFVFQQPGTFVDTAGELPFSLARDGSKMAFTRRNGRFDKAIVRDVFTGQEQPVAVTAAGVIGNNSSRFPILAQNGKNVLFDSNATNLSRAARNGTYNLYVKTISSSPLDANLR